MSTAIMHSAAFYDFGELLLKVSVCVCVCEFASVCVCLCWEWSFASVRTLMNI